ncbi:hypothetical protein FZW96_07320 [Bacillus sp. BGMRC 2118]|nr:hypothetical protein FZW96_07320 [Bacillus sp. BGMRC 2118]
MKILKYTWVVPVILLALGMAVYYFTQIAPQETSQEDKKEKASVTTVVKEAASKLVNPNSVNTDFPLDMTEDEVQVAIHYMSHQKVYAEEKWGAIELTPDNVERLLAVVQENKEEFYFTDTYFDILERWAREDFSRAQHDHNDMWNIQRGTVGEATRLLTENEEQEFIEKHFE